MNARKMLWSAALSLPLALSGAFAAQVWAHGADRIPASRVYFCRFNDRGGPENPQTDGCKAAKAASGSTPTYTWNETSKIDANGRRLDALPDGQFCNAGRDAFKGYNLPDSVANWTKTPISGGPLAFEYFGTAPHATNAFVVYLTKPSYDGRRPITRADLDLVREVKDFTLTGDTFRYSVNMPARASGSKAVIVEVWERVAQQSGEAFYTCMDVIYR